MKFITFIGNRNIDHHNESLDKDHSLNENKNNQKDMAKAILEDYEREKEFIEEKFISFFLKNNNTYKFDKYFIIGTNQDDKGAGKNDTIYHAKIIQKKLEENFEDCVGKVEIIEYNKDPSNEKEISIFLNENLPKYLKKDDDVVFLNAGGTCQLKMNMIFWGINSENLKSFNVFSLKDYSNKIEENYWPRIITELRIREDIKKSLDSWEIKYSRSLIDNFNIINKGLPEYQYIKFLEERINNLDLINSFKLIKNDKINKYFSEVSEYDRETIKEIFSLTQILYEKKNYLLITLLLRSFSDIFKKIISEEMKMEIPSHEDEKERKKWNDKIIKKIKELNKIEQEIFFFTSNKDGLSKFRNSSLITHGIGSISKDEFDGLFANSYFEKYSNFMNQADESFHWKEKYNNYIKIKDAIKKKI